MEESTKSEAKRRATGIKAASDIAETDADTAPTRPEALRRKEFVQRVAARAGLRASKVKPVVDAVLAELGETLVSGQPLVLPPLGKVSINKRKDGADRDIMILKLRRARVSSEDETPDDPLATAAE